MLALAALAFGVAIAEAQRPTPPGLVEPPAGVLAALTEQILSAHLRFLTDDLLEGRGPGTRGGDLAARYIAAQLQATGLRPVASSSYAQSVPLVGIRSEASLVVGTGRRTMVLDEGTDFVLRPELQDSQIVFDGELVFAGFGIDAPEESWNDFAGGGVAGKVVVVRAGEPGGTDSSAFGGSAATQYGGWSYKVDQARRAGAAGVLLIHDLAAGAGPWDAVVATWRREIMVPERVGAQGLRFAGWITPEAARRMVEATGKDYALVMRRAEVPGFRAIDLGARAALDLHANIRGVRHANLIGMLDGSDTSAASEPIYFVAHYDHLGIGLPENGDSVYNGAVDNASGTAALLALARAFASASHRPRRSIVFAATTAGEAGLAGAIRLAAGPPMPERISAVINLHEIGLWDGSDELVGIGADLSTLGTVLRGAAKLEGLVLSSPSGERAGDIYVSDHSVFARLGVPVLALATQGARRSVRSDAGRSNGTARYRAERWHRPSDEVGEEANLSALVRQLRMLARLGWHVAQDSSPAAWLPGSAFESIPRRTPPAR